MRIFYEDVDPGLEVELAAASEARAYAQYLADEAEARAYAQYLADEAEARAYAQYLADEAEKRRIEEEEWWALVLEEGVPIEA